MTNNIEFLKNRKKGVGGSDIAAVLGFPSFRTAVEIWEDKINPEVEEVVLRPDDHTAGMYWGKILERKIMDTYSLVEEADVTYEKGNGDDLDQVRHSKYPWLIANPDGIAHTKEHGDIILEAKHWHYDQHGKWGENGTDNIPVDYMCQVQHYMNVLNMPMAHVALKLGCDFRIYKVPRSERIISGMHDKLKYFWFENVKKKIAPEPSNLSDVKIIYKESNGDEKEATEEQIKSVQEIKRLKNEISKLEKTLEARKTGIANDMGEYGSLVAGNERIATLNENKHGSRTLRFPKVSEV